METLTYYFIGHLIQGEASEWHKSVAKDISHRFGTWKIYEKIPPHVTVFQPFGTGDVSVVKNLLKNFVGERSIPGNYSIDGFGRFDDRVIFADIKAEAGVTGMALELKKELYKLPAMPEEEFPDWNPHATLINKITPEEINKIWEYVNTLEKPDFTLPFDNLALFRFGGDRRWLVEEVFRLQ